jgi:hypothetical protein
VYEIADATGRTIHAVLLVNGYSFSGLIPAAVVDDSRLRIPGARKS